MLRWRIVFFLLWMTLPALSQQVGSSYVPLQKIPVLKKLIETNTTVWEVGLKGLKSTTISFDGGDTVVYSISRERSRRATFTLLDSNTVLVEPDFKSNIISGGFTDSLQGTYIFKVKNHSFLGNKFTLQVWKTKPKPEPKVVSKPTKDTTYFYPDSIVTLMDTTIYLACTLNLNQPQEYILPYQADSAKFATVVNAIEVSMLKYPDVAKPKRTPILNTKNSKMSNLSQGTLLIYLKQHSYLDSLQSSSGKERQVERFTIVPNEKLVVVNNDKVVGKYVHIQIKEILRCNKPKMIIRDVK